MGLREVVAGVLIIGITAGGCAVRNIIPAPLRGSDVVEMPIGYPPHFHQYDLSEHLPIKIVDFSEDNLGNVVNTIYDDNLEEGVSVFVNSIRKRYGALPENFNPRTTKNSRKAGFIHESRFERPDYEFRRLYVGEYPPSANFPTGGAMTPDKFKVMGLIDPASMNRLYFQILPKTGDIHGRPVVSGIVFLGDSIEVSIYQVPQIQ